MAAKSRSVISIASIIVLLAIQGIHGLFEDQVGMYDWHQKYIGRVKLAEFQTQGQRKRVYVATEQNVLAALNLKTGQIAWRRVLGENEPIEGLQVYSKYVVTLSGGGKLLRAWSAMDGVLQWDATILPFKDLTVDAAVDFHTIPTDAEGGSLRDIVVLSGGGVYRLSGATGELKWQTRVSATKLHVTKDAIYAVSFTNPTGLSALGIAITRINIETGEAEQLTNALAPVTLSASRLILTGNFLVVLDYEGSKIFTAEINRQPLTLVESSVGELVKVGESSGAVLLPAKLDGAFGLGARGSFIVVEVGEGGKLKAIMEVRQPAALSDMLKLEDGRSAIGVVHHTGEEEGREIVVKAITAQGEVEEGSEEKVTLKAGRGNVEVVFINSYRREKKDSFGYRLLVVAEDDSLSLLQQGRVVWEREEALASVVDVKIVDLPSAAKGKGEHVIEHTLQDWFKDHWLRAKTTVMMATPEERELVQKMRISNSAKNAPFRDHNGFRRLIILLTRPGKLLALHTGDGRIMWSTLIQSFRAPFGSYASVLEKPVPLKLMVSQDTHRVLKNQAPEIIVLGRKGPTKEGGSMIVYVNGHTGEQVQSVDFTFPISLSIQLPLIDSNGKRLLMLVSDEKTPKIHVLPMTEEANFLFTRHASTVFFYVVNEEGEIRGYGVGEKVKERQEKEPEGLQFGSIELWKVIFPADMERIATAVARRADESVHTQTRALGNRSVQYKYINKNLLFVATVAPPKAAALGPITPEESWMVAYILDTVTGRVLHRIVHNNMQGPVHAAMAENWIVYHYFNLRNHRYEMSVVELYDDSDRGSAGEIAKYALGFGGGNLTAPLSSWAVPSVRVQSQSYFFSHSLKTMTVTSTSRGITNRQLLLGTVADQVLAMDKRFLDPRRSITPTQQDREEGLLPYSDTLPITPQAYLTHGLQVEGLRGVLSEPSRLESTTLVFAHGIDLFYLRTAPSRTYDTLSEDFSYVLLLVTIAALLGAILVTWVLAERRELERKWR